MPMALPPTRDDLAAELKVFIPKVGRWKHESSCGICGCEFSYLRGRHHCRYCGASVCNKHSRNRAVVPSSMSTEKQRVCDMCYPKCQYGIPLQRRRGMTTADGVPGTSRSVNFTLLDVTDSSDPRLVKTERGRARTMMGGDARPHSRSRSRSPPQTHSQRGAKDVSWDPAQRWREQQAARERERGSGFGVSGSERRGRQRGISEPPERHMKKMPVKTKAPPSPPPSPPSPLSPMTRQSISHDVFQMSPQKPKMKKFGSPYQPPKKGSSKTLSIRKQFSASPPPPPSKPFNIPLDHPLDASFAPSDFMSSFASVRDTKEQDDIAMQYLASFIKAENMTVQETNHVTVSHSNAGPLLGMTTVVEMKPASPKELQLSTSVSPPPSEASFPTVLPTTSQNRKLSVSSVCTVSVSDGEEEEKPVAKSEWDVSIGDDDFEFKMSSSHLVSPRASLTVEVKPQYSTSGPAWKQPSPTKANDISTKLSSSVTFAANTKPSEPEISDEGLDLMRDIMDLEKQIHEYQSELPKLMDEWKRVEHIANVLRTDARESRDKVLQYQRARALVSRAIRVGTKFVAEKEFEAAALELSRAAAIERTNPKVWYLLADCRMKMGQLAEAEEACRVSIELQHSAVGVALLGRILHALGRHDDAIKCYLTALGR